MIQKKSKRFSDGHVHKWSKVMLFPYAYIKYFLKHAFSAAV